MSEKPVTTTPPVDEEEEKRRKMREEEEKEEDMSMEKHLSKIYKALGEMTDAVRELAGFVKSSSEVHRGVEEAIKSLSSRIENIEKVVTIGFESTAKENEKAEKFKNSGQPQAVGDKVNIPANELREPGAEMLEKGIIDIEKSLEYIKKALSVSRPDGLRVDAKVGGEGVDGLVKNILSGKVKIGEVPRLLKEVVG
jgi:DNA repair exonuclease SbcCD ATPase subunit